MLCTLNVAMCAPTLSIALRTVGARRKPLFAVNSCVVNIGRLAVVIVGCLVALSSSHGSDSLLQFESGTLSLGECNQGQTATGVVRFRNVGPHSIRLTEITGTCSCTVVTFSDGEIGAGGEGKFTVSMSTDQRVGKCDGQLTVKYESAGKSQSEKVTVSAFVRAEGKLVAQPETLYLVVCPARLY